MDNSVAMILQGAVEKELARRFDHDDSAMAEYIVVMLQNGKDEPAVTGELNDLISNYDASFTSWIFEQVGRLQSGRPIVFPGEDVVTKGPESGTEGEMQVDSQKGNSQADTPGMGYPASRLYSDVKKTLQDNVSATQRTRHRPDNDTIRSTPYGTVAVGNGAMRIPTGPRAAEGQQARTNNAGPMRSQRNRAERSNGNGRQANATMSDFPEMPQFPGFPMPPAQFFAGMPLMNRLGGIDGAPVVGGRAPTRRCTKWPNCFKGKSCTFGHPTSMCQNPNCRKTDGSCPSIHADEDVDLLSGIGAQARTEEEREAKAAMAQEAKAAKSYGNGSQKYAPGESDGSVPICKFGEACTNRSCHFAHPSPASKAGSSVVLNSQFCEAGMECKDENCSFSHPSPSNKYTPGVKLNTIAGDVLCKFHPCLNPSCRFQHGPGQKAQTSFAAGGARNKVWTPNSVKTTAERNFVAGEVEEQFNSGSNVHDNDTEMEK